MDSNLWLALCFSDHVHHGCAAFWFETLGDGNAAFCRVTQMALLRHLTNPKIMGKFVLPQRAAWEQFDKLARDFRVIFLHEMPSVEAHWRQLTQADEPRHSHWTDAYLAAFAQASGVVLATTDKDFKQFSGLELELVKTD